MDVNERLDTWRDALILDGWDWSLIYSNPDAVNPSIKFMREGFSVHIYRKTEDGGDALSNSITAWGPDDLHIDLPSAYSFDALVAATKVCGYCGKTGSTRRIGFAGRVCEKCHKENVARVEYPGWCS